MTAFLYVILGAGGFFALGNCMSLIRVVLSKKSTSLIPLIGGILIAISSFFLFGPIYALLGFLDPGLTAIVIAVLIMPLKNKKK